MKRLMTLIHTKGSAFQASSSKKAHVTIIEFGVGSAMAALIGELVSVVNPKAVCILGSLWCSSPILESWRFYFSNRVY